MKLGRPGEAIVDRSVYTHLYDAGLDHFLDDSDDDFRIGHLDESLTLGIGLYDDRKVAIGTYNEVSERDHIAMLISPTTPSSSGAPTSTINIAPRRSRRGIHQQSLRRSDAGRRLFFRVRIATDSSGSSNGGYRYFMKTDSRGVIRCADIDIMYLRSGFSIQWIFELFRDHPRDSYPTN